MLENIVWHLRFGHQISFLMFALMYSKNLVDNLLLLAVVLEITFVLYDRHAVAEDIPL